MRAQKRPCPLSKEYSAYLFFFFPYSQAVLLETALEIGAPLAGVLLYQVPASDISALQ